jgi:hypothetical protein
MKRISITVGLILIAGFLVSWHRQDSREPKARIPDFPLKALGQPSATRAGLFVSRDGAITRYTVHVGPEALPEWVSQMADERIGKGENVEYECELYPDGSEVYEIYRLIDGREKQLSVHADRTVKYLGRQMDEKELPERVGATLRGLKSFFPEKIICKEGPGFVEYHIRGRIGGAPHRVRISGDGRLIAVQKKVPAEIELAIQE